MEPKPRASAFFRAAQLGAAPEPQFPAWGVIWTPKGNGERGFVSQKGVQNNWESCGLGGVRSCCRGGCGSLKGVLRGHWLGLAQGVRSRAQGESLRPLPAWGSLPHCTLQLNQPPTSGSA